MRSAQFRIGTLCLLKSVLLCFFSLQCRFGHIFVFFFIIISGTGGVINAKQRPDSDVWWLFWPPAFLTQLRSLSAGGH